MTRDKIIDNLRKSPIFRCRDVFDIVCANAADMLASDKRRIGSLSNAVEKLQEKLDEFPQWHYIRYGLPDPNTTVLVKDDANRFYVAYITGRENGLGCGTLAYGDNTIKITNITHWKDIATIGNKIRT